MTPDRSHYGPAERMAYENGRADEKAAAASPAWTCKVRAANTGANDPQDCAWPECDCDPVANKVMEYYIECDAVILQKGTVDQMVDRVFVSKDFANWCERDGDRAIFSSGYGSGPIVINVRKMIVAAGLNDDYGAVSTLRCALLWLRNRGEPGDLAVIDRVLGDVQYGRHGKITNAEMDRFRALYVGNLDSTSGVMSFGDIDAHRKA